MTYTYRRANPADAEAIVAIIRQWNDETPWVGPLDDYADVLSWWRACLTHVPTSWVAEKDGKTVGFCVRDDDNITGLYVARAARNRGVGKHLLDLAKQDRDWITVWSYALNANARNFYRREGCIEISRETEEGSGLVDVEHRWTRRP
ncbi:MAG: GNAT family N-acetyltransferase [Pseudomonadota bacterium]